ncbi:MAG: hypothetical protein H6658_15030 [Ardenticatenaceae bacterium]|nr:hypothetical protein [Ardenticatenaceae bacterium]
MSSPHLLPLIQEVVQAFSLHYQEAMQPVLNRYGFAGGDWLRVFFAYGLDPQPLTIDIMQSVLPFNSEAVNRRALRTACDHGLLTEVDDHSFRLSEAGREGITAFYQATGQAIADLRPLPEAAMNQLADLLLRVVVGSETAVIPKTRLHLSRHSDPGSQAAAPVRIDQYLTDLANFRNDAVRASWMALNVSGPAWEALGHVAENGEQTAVTISQQFSERRGHSADVYAAALTHLANLGWLAPTGGSYTITSKGQAVRDEAAQTADRTFYTGWSNLTSAEQTELESLLQQINNCLREAGMHQIWQLANGALGTAAPLYTDKTAPVLAAKGLNKPGYFFTIWQGLGLEPHPISAANFARRFPYIAPQVHATRLQNLLDDGLIGAGENEGDYVLTTKGREAYTAVDTLFTAELSQLEILPANGLEQLVEVIGGVAERSAGEAGAGDRWSIQAMRRMHRPDAPPQVRLDEYLDDLNAFRDDAHLAACAAQAPGLSGPALEAFTFLWRDGLNTGAALQERLAFRGYDAAAYEAALRELVAEAWATEEAGLFAITEAGRTVREAIERQTDKIFFAPWAELSNAQLGQLLRQLRQLRQNLQAMVDDKIVAERRDVWPQVQAVGGALARIVIGRTQAVREALGLNRPFATLAILTAFGDEKGLITAKHLGQRFPYVRPDALQGFLQNLAETGELRRGQNGTADAYYLTENGRHAAQKHLDTFWGEVAKLHPLPEAELAQVAEMLERVVASVAQTAEPAHPGFAAMQALAAPEDAAALVRIDHTLDCLSAFRDDAHVAAFHVPGYVWEAFSDVWQGEANTAKAIAERRQNRGYETADYAQALTQLTQRGWLSVADGVYSLTEAGQTVREEAERLTDRYFYRPWAVLNLDEVQAMRDLLAKLAAGLEALAEPVAA